jgi:transcriptional regulator with XRE-family HTH domain
MRSERAGEVLRFVAANLFRARVRAQMTQEQLAELADIDLRFLQRVERGQTNVSVAVVVALADALGVPVGGLFRRAALPEAMRGRPRRSPALRASGGQS